MKKYSKSLLFGFILVLEFAKSALSQEHKATPAQTKIIEKYLENGAFQFSYFSKEWQVCIDEGLKEDSTIGYLWQQKAMPLFKQRKYDYAMGFLDKAVFYDSSWLSYRAFMKCIFSKTYAEALLDFKICRQKEPKGRVMDHTFDFYMALCYLQQNKFQDAEFLLEGIITETRTQLGNDWVHHLELFYYGISLYESRNYPKAYLAFEEALKRFPQFSDAKFYFGRCQMRLQQVEKGLATIKEAEEDYKKGFGINEDNAIYEVYPYQVNWKMMR
jgi:tetratricopeptide (TPR) repeat protein